MNSTSIDKLTAAVARGEAPAVEEFYRRYFDFMYRLARRASRRDESFCLDVVQDATLRILRCIKPMSTETHLLNWTRLVVQTCALDRIKSEKRRSVREAVTAPPDNGPPGDATDDAEQSNWLAAQIGRLDPELAQLIEMRFVHGWTLARIAATLGGKTGAIDGRLRRAIATLRDAAREAFDE